MYLVTLLAWPLRPDCCIEWQVVICYNVYRQMSVCADVGGLVNFLKDWMSVHTEQAPAAPEPLFARHHVYPVRPCLSVCLSVCLCLCLSI